MSPVVALGFDLLDELEGLLAVLAELKPVAEAVRPVEMRVDVRCVERGARGEAHEKCGAGMIEKCRAGIEMIESKLTLLVEFEKT